MLATPTRWDKLSMISAISPRGEVGFRIVEGTINAERFKEFLAALIEEARRFKYRNGTIERLLDRDTDPADGFTQHLFEVAMPRARAYDRIMRESNGDPSGIEFKSEGTGRARYAVVLPDASQQGKWRISYFDERGFSSHHVEETRDAAVKSMVSDGFTIESRGTLDELAATREWKLGTDYADIIDQLNRKIITHDEFMRLQAKLNEDYERDKNGAPRAEAVAQGPDLAAPTQQDVLAQQERRENADALDERARIDREAAAAPAPSADTLRAQADLNNALADLGDLLGRPFRANIAPEQEAKLVPILTRVLDAAFRMGYYKFKDAARFALDTIREKIGADVADALAAVFRLEIIHDLLAVDIGEVDIDIGHADAIRVKKTLKQQPVLERIKIGDAYRVGNNRTGSTAPSGTKNNTL